jgi:hypothetical protein
MNYAAEATPAVSDRTQPTQAKNAHSHTMLVFAVLAYIGCYPLILPSGNFQQTT